MPAAIALAIRAAIQFAITWGILEISVGVLMPLLQKAVQHYMVSKGYTEEQAKDSVANDVLEIALTLGIGAATLRSKLPTKAAEYLGFTTKGWGKRTVSATVATKVAPKAAATALPSATAVVAAATGVTVAGSKIASYGAGAQKISKFIGGILTPTFLGFLAFGQFFDYANWETGAYSDFWQGVFNTVSFGLITPNEDYRKTKTVSPEVFDKVYNTYLLKGAVNINNKYTGQTVPFTRDNLIDLLDRVGADLLVKTGSASTKEVLAASQFLISFDQAKVQAAASSAGYSQATGGGSYSAIPTAPKVYTGIVSQGVLGRGLEFVPRQDDLIESAEELRAAAANNLSPFLQSLIGKIVYEVKIVASIITKEGFKQTGTVQQIRNGSYSDGRPKYKSVYNKFAVMDLFVITDKGARSKIQTIVLGPTDSSRLNLATADLRSIEASIPSLVFTKDINEITGIETVKSITVSTPPAAGGEPVPAPLTGTAVTTGGPDSTPTPRAEVRGINALTLSDWFAAQGQPFPNVEARSYDYERLGLGQRNFYTGTAEQNTKLLAAFKLEAQTKVGTYQWEESDVEGGKELIYYPPGMTPNKALKTSAPVTSTDKKKEPTKELTKATAEKKVTRIYTTTGGERVTKYSDGTEKRTKKKK